MRRFLVLLFISLFLSMGCQGLQITDSSTHQAMAYFAGKGVGVAINKLYPEADESLGTAWDDLIEKNKGNEEISSEDMIGFYGNCIAILGTFTGDPYGLIGDLGALLTIFGAQFDDSGKLIALKPVPMSIMKMFEMGYDNGKIVALERRVFLDFHTKDIYANLGPGVKNKFIP